MKKTPWIIGLVSLAAAGSAYALTFPTSPLAGRWVGTAVWEGPPAECPLGEGACDHTVDITIGCSGLTGVSKYVYPNLEDYTCEGEIVLDGSAYRETSVSPGCIDGRVTITPSSTFAGFRWENATNLGEDTIGYLTRIAQTACTPAQR
jgi:hypothetical protein